MPPKKNTRRNVFAGVLGNQEISQQIETPIVQNEGGGSTPIKHQVRKRSEGIQSNPELLQRKILSTSESESREIEFSENEEEIQSWIKGRKQGYVNHAQSAKRPNLTVTVYILLVSIFFIIIARFVILPWLDAPPNGHVAGESKTDAAELEPEFKKLTENDINQFEMLKQELTDLRTDFNTLINEKIPNQVNGYNKKLQEFEQDLTAKLRQSCKNQLSQAKQKMSDRCIRQLQQIQHKFYTLSKKLSLETTLTTELSNVNKKCAICSEMKHEFDSLKQTIEDVKTKLESLSKNIQNEHTKIYNKTDEHDAEINKIKSQAESNKQIHVTYGTALVVCIANGVLIVILVMVITKLQTYKETKSVSSAIDDINRRDDLENSLCIVSFTRQTETKHCDMVNSFIDRNIQSRSYIVNGKGDLKDMPPSKLCMVFVDYDDRNIILESENESGDLKKTTVKAIIKMGGDVILVYCGDELSTVTGTELYNKRLFSIYEQEELKQLETKHRVLSVYNNTSFTDHQKQHLRDLTASLKRYG